MEVTQDFLIGQLIRRAREAGSGALVKAEGAQDAEHVSQPLPSLLAASTGQA